MRVIVCGSRNFGERPDQRARIHAALDALHAKTPITFLWHGNARGVDSAAGEWAMQHKTIRVCPVPAEWSKYGDRAGPIRNKNMLGQGIELVIAFPGGKGTTNMVTQAERAGVRVIKMVLENGPVRLKCTGPLEKTFGDPAGAEATHLQW